MLQPLEKDFRKGGMGERTPLGRILFGIIHRCGASEVPGRQLRRQADLFYDGQMQRDKHLSAKMNTVHKIAHLLNVEVAKRLLNEWL